MKPRMSELPLKKPAVVLLSGGLDSATALAMAIDMGLEPYCMSFRYGQGHVIELEASSRVAQAHNIKEHRIVDIDLRAFGGSALTDDIEVPKGRNANEMNDGIPVTYVPARNTIFLSYALAWAEVLGAFDIFIGVNAVDYSGYPDCRPEFVTAFETMANLATAAAVEGKGHFTVHAPLLNLTKAEIIVEGIRLSVDYGLTHSCYDPVGELACGECDSCILRRQGFEDAEVQDPTQYA